MLYSHLTRIAKCYDFFLLICLKKKHKKMMYTTFNAITCESNNIELYSAL